MTIRYEFVALYNACLKNATELLAEANILFGRENYARAYALAFTALEEISKSQLAADVFTGFITDKEFRECFRNHPKKIERVAWATEEAKHYLAMPEEVYIEVHDVTFASRQSALFVGFENGKITSPSGVIGREDARSIIHTTETAIHQIIEAVFLGHEIGTKGFM